MLPTRSFLLGLLLLIVVVAAATYHGVLELTLLGWDAYPMIVSAKLSSIADLPGIFSEELMGGRYPDGHFYRPLTSLTLALDHLFWGLDARGYHLSDLLILVVNSIALGLVGWRLLAGVGGSAEQPTSERRSAQRVMAVIAALLFLLHPIQLELLPVSPRRADALCLTFTLLALLGSRESSSTRRKVLVGLLAFSAAASKESGALVAPLVFSWLLVLASHSGRARWTAAMRGSLPVLAGVLLFVALRTIVLGGLGGHAESSIGGLASIASLIEPYWLRVIYPQPFAGVDSGARLAVLISGALLAIVSFLTTRETASSSRSDEQEKPAASRAHESRLILLWLASWATLLLLISSLSGRVHDWYAMLFSAPFALWIAFLLTRSWEIAREQSRARGLCLGALPLIAACCLLANSPANPLSTLANDERWSTASLLTESLLSRAVELVDASKVGEDVLLDHWVPLLAPPEGGHGVRSAAILAPYSVDAYLELLRPERPVEVAPLQATLPESDGQTLRIWLKTGSR